MNFTRTALDFHITQPTLSRHIEDLERELSCSLFQRNTRNVRLTQEGQIFLPYAKQILISRDKSIFEIEKYHQYLGEHLTIGFRPILTQDFVLLRDTLSLSKRYPNIKLSFHSISDLQLLIQSLMTNQTDVILIVFPNKITLDDNNLKQIELENYLHSNLQAEYHFINHVPLYAMMAQHHPLAHKDSISLEDLNNQTIILADPKIHSPIYANSIKSFLSIHNVGVKDFIYIEHMGESLMTQNILNAINLLPACYIGDNLYSMNVSIPVVEGDAFCSLIYMWKKTNTNPLLHELFVDTQTQQ